MVSVGSKALISRTRRIKNFVENSWMGEQGKSHKLGKRKKGLSRKAKEKNYGIDETNSDKNGSGHGGVKAYKSQKKQDIPVSQSSIVRKQVDPETAKYFTEIANLFESNGVELEERSVICGNALEETRGKEYELATDYIISHFLQTLLEGSDVDQLCGFLKSSASVFPFIAMDRSGSHVAETALKSLAMHLEDREVYSTVEETLSVICKVIVANSVDVMCNCYGSHVLRRLLCLCKGVSTDSPEFHGMKSSTILAQRLNLSASRSETNDLQNLGPAFPDLLKFLVSGLLNCSSDVIKTLLVNQCSSLVLQTTLKLLAGDEELLQIIPTLLGSKKENVTDGSFIETGLMQDVLNLVKETSYSHLLEVMVEVAPTDLYNEMFHKIFRNSLFEMSSHQSGSFVVQAIVSNARGQDQLDLIWEELGTKFKDLLVLGRSGVIGSLVATTHRLSLHEYKCCQALAAAVCSTNDSPACIVPRLLFLDSFFRSEDQSGWEWPSNAKMHVMGSLILQAVFKYKSELIQPFITSMTSMEINHILGAAKDAIGTRVLEAFLTSNTPWKQKRKFIVKLQGHFGEISMHSSGSFIVEKCFNASNASLKETIVSELLAVRNDLSKTKHGPHVLRKLDVDGYAARPDQWKKKQETKQSTYKEFFDIFGSGDAKSHKDKNFLADDCNKAAQSADIKQMRKEIDQLLTSAAPSTGKSSFKRQQENMEKQSKKHSIRVEYDGRNQKRKKHH